MVERKTNSTRLIGLIGILIIIIACLISLVPYLWTFLSGFKYRTDILSTTPKLIFTPTLENFPEVFIKNVAKENGFRFSEQMIERMLKMTKQQVIDFIDNISNPG